MAQQAGHYGVDGGGFVLPIFAGLMAGLLGAAVWARRRGRSGWAVLAGGAASAVGASAASYLYSSTRGKFGVWDEILDQLQLVGDEQLLDIGCGRGAVLFLGARRLTSGRAVGVDVWRRRDQTGNTRSAAEHNARAEGVADRVDLVEGDARSLPFPDASFDVVVSSLAIHNIAGAEGRDQALREAVRVLRPGGRLRIVDQRLGHYAQTLRAAGCRDVAVRRLDWRVWFGTPGDPLVLVSATGPR